ncbi:AcrR family transcriptional regulator [Rhodopseudomonas rhenobacensis]|uniref:AcrR family transcriptional regulator n=1 Tax=Rhodopseudomonas rhenobacensis TaxID=87461 RepID=A0A7W8DY79_9BRAD|nr:TetR/AcrR family transcriptional regulator [Rhodopseudomonas rhenobacensis]MBB5046653.1 AcrR family transcriptional regulator [Rhodopseudomonas rhenobacensis]
MNVTKAKPNKVVRRRSGRPTKEQAGQITDHIVVVATRLFSETSFEATTVDLIAAKAGISKQTFYARFDSKEALFAAVIRKRMNDLFLASPGQPDRAGPIEPTLVRIGVELSKRALSPAAIAIDRLISSEAYQFRQLALAYQESATHARGLIAGIFSNAMREGQITTADSRFLAQQFLFSVVDGPTRALILTGKTAKPEQELREQVRAAVDLFLDGCRPSDRSA